MKALPCNGWGLYQMHGNVWEWCQDWYAVYPAATADTPAVDPVGPATGASRVLRGGSWFNRGWFACSALRLAGLPGGRDDGLGFRLARGHARPVAPEALEGCRAGRAGQT